MTFHGEVGDGWHRRTEKLSDFHDFIGHLINIIQSVQSRAQGLKPNIFLSTLRHD
jgi:hypothetical protein